MIRGIDLYEILQVSPTAEKEEITAAYRRLARQYHPQINKGPSATEKFRQITAAYEIMGDPVKRRKYDWMRKQQHDGRGTFPTSRTIAKQAFWDKHASFLMRVMLEWKQKHFGGMATIYHNQPSFMIPPLDSPEMTIPNITCQGATEYTGIWGGESADGFVVGIFSLSASYVAVREHVQADGLRQALLDCSNEVKAITGYRQSKRPREIKTTREDIAEEILAGDKRRFEQEYFSEKTLDGLLYLARRGNTERATLNMLKRWVMCGAWKRSGVLESDRQHISAVHYYEVCQAFAGLAETKPQALQYLTNAIVEDADGTAWVEHAGLLDAFLQMDPQKALPETRECIDRILTVKTKKCEQFKEFKRRMPGGGFRNWFGS